MVLLSIVNQNYLFSFISKIQNLAKRCKYESVIMYIFLFSPPYYLASITEEETNCLQQSSIKRILRIFLTKWPK